MRFMFRIDTTDFVKAAFLPFFLARFEPGTVCPSQERYASDGVLKETAEEVAVLLGLRYVFMQTAAEIRLEPSFTFGSRSTLCQGRNGRVTNRLCTSG